MSHYNRRSRYGLQRMHHRKILVSITSHVGEITTKGTEARGSDSVHDLTCTLIRSIDYIFHKYGKWSYYNFQAPSVTHTRTVVTYLGNHGETSPIAC